METTTISKSAAAQGQSRLSTAARRTWIRRLLILAVVVAPMAVTIGLIEVRLRAHLTDFIPNWNDEVSYWHQTLTFTEAGFNGGYYTVNERPAAAAFTHFYTHGPWYPMLFGTIGKLIGWQFYTPVIINLALITAALAIFVLVIHLDTIQLILMGFLLVTFWPVLLYLPTAMQESIHQFHAVILAVVFLKVLDKRDQLPLRWQAVFTLYLVVAGVTRLSWSILLLPLFVLTARPGLRGYVLALVKTAAAFAVVFFVTQQVGAPGNNSIFSGLEGFSVSFGHGLQSLWQYATNNLQYLFDVSNNPVVVMQTFQVIALTVILLAAPLYFRWRRRENGFTEFYFHVYNLSGIVVATLVLYLIGTMGDYRVVGTHLLLSLLVLIARRRFYPVAFVVVTSLLVVTPFLRLYRDYGSPKFGADRPALAAYAEVLHVNLQYNANAPTAWCNTLLHDIKDLSGPLLTGVPAGIGESFFFEPDEVSLPFRSQYLLVTDEVYQSFMERDPALKLVLLAELPNDRKLYRNDDSGCEEGQS